MVGRVVHEDAGGEGLCADLGGTQGSMTENVAS